MTSLKHAVKKRLPVSPLEGSAVSRLLPGALHRVLASDFFLRARQELYDRVDRISLRQIGSTLESRLDQAADDLCPADRFAMLQTNVDGKAIEIGDVTVEQHDRDFRPGLGVDNGATAIALCRTHTLSCFALN
ncbi:MAG TPA: hypothetical protein VHW00_25500 [Thermoanaerobaculia bacterium]|nr:hypothetical protein [Thermoanaerobaculia bacterium]